MAAAFAAGRHDAVDHVVALTVVGERARCTYRIVNPSGLVRYVLDTDDRERQLQVGVSGWVADERWRS
jgi:hypothetical protein